MKSLKFSFNLTPTNPVHKLGAEVWINDQCVFDLDHVQQAIAVSGILPDNSIPADHTLKLILKNKLPSHTQLSSTGEIASDSCLVVSDLKFDDIELAFDILKTAVYQHNFNNSAELANHEFFGTLGCNGVVELKFSTPIYLWMLEHM